ncbi:MAG TPA: prolyl aminopeptidase [Aliidongia sp.]|nr:prolyl aminopeptidase [Aliidongia sp.]
MTEMLRHPYPPIEPYASGRLDVGDGHQVYWERCGRQGGIPAVFLHGGPGVGCMASNRQFFDPARYDVLLFDQRGCGRSLPHAGLEANTTWHLVADIERLRAMCGHESWLVFGGSWGATLALAYAETHPERVTGLILRGIFLSRQSELDWLYGNGANWLYPEKWERFLAPIPEGERGDLFHAYHRRLTGGDAAERVAFARAWSAWEGETATLLANPAVAAMFSDENLALSFASISAHYFIHRSWLEEEQLLRAAGRIRNIPGTIVQGRYDLASPVRSAWELHRAWPEAEFHLIPDAGHAASEPGTLDRLLRAADAHADRLG